MKEAVSSLSSVIVKFRGSQPWLCFSSSLGTFFFLKWVPRTCHKLSELELADIRAGHECFRSFVDSYHVQPNWILEALVSCSIVRCLYTECVPSSRNYISKWPGTHPNCPNVDPSLKDCRLYLVDADLGLACCGSPYSGNTWLFEWLNRAL